MSLELVETKAEKAKTGLMKANVFHGPGKFWNRTQTNPWLTTICDTDIHIVRGEYPVKPGLIIGHEAVGVCHALGQDVQGYEIGQRVLIGAITPCGQCEPCLAGNTSQCVTALGGWRLGNTIDGVQAEYARIPFARANLAVIPDNLSDEDVLLLADIAPTGFSAAENGEFY